MKKKELSYNILKTSIIDIILLTIDINNNICWNILQLVFLRIAILISSKDIGPFVFLLLDTLDLSTPSFSRS